MSHQLYLNFDKSAFLNPFLNLYVAAYQKSILFHQRAEDLTLLSFDANANYISMPQSKSSVAAQVWISETTSVAFIDNDNSQTNQTEKFVVSYCTG